MLGKAHTPSQWRDSLEDLSQHTQELSLVDPETLSSPQAVSQSASSTTPASASSEGATSALDHGVYLPEESTSEIQQSEIPGRSLQCIPDSQEVAPPPRASWLSDIEEFSPNQQVPCTYQDELNASEDQQVTEVERYEDLIDSQAYSCPEDIYPHDSQDSDQAGTSDAGRPTGDHTAVPRHVDPHNLRARFSHIGRAYRKNYRKFAKKVVPKWKSQYVPRVPGAYRRLMKFLAGEEARRDIVSASRHPRGTAFHSTPEAPRGNARSPATQRPQKQPSPAPSGPVVTMDSMDFIDLTSTATESSQCSRSSSSVSSLVSLPDSMVDSRKCDTALPAPLPSISRPTKSYLDGNISDSEMDEAYQHAFADPGTPPSAQRLRTQSGWL